MTTNVEPCINCGSVEEHPRDLYPVWSRDDRRCGRCPLPCNSCGSTVAYPNDFYGCGEPEDEPGGAEWVRLCGACNSFEGNVDEFFAEPDEDR